MNLLSFLIRYRDRDFPDESRIYCLYDEAPSHLFSCSSTSQDATTETRGCEDDVLHHLSLYMDIHYPNVVPQPFEHVLLYVWIRRTSRPSLCSCLISRHDSYRDH
ncbi:hypothetical protein NY2A_b448L [Paramecium bursaria Chlorella virus NY2A]|uniref:Uncharacterized protein b448L n=1 Tax=Paramecium bursaria Chlorella virus NY2A TaxID=46021 RepID=A7IWX3_PBCVN|nr:hypothetical protein NY2A_b448L [Paramecium bursaria Chlorella virus NY2A]ABT14847.1 hypothetical protein NY2A_b448L [Paramecium bursaria Chlorella virus NY2A]